MTATVLAGAARLPLAPPLGLPMLGFIRQPTGALGYGRLPLETTALVLRDPDGETVVLVGVDVAYIPAPDCDELVARIAAATGADPAAVLVNCSHTHLAPYGGVTPLDILGELEPSGWSRVAAAARAIQEQALDVAVNAAARLEPARVVWGVGRAPVAANRRERTAEGATILGWNPRELVDERVTTLQARRRDESAVATVVAFGCHPVTTGFDMTVYSSDYAGALRAAIREAGGGECVFLQGAAGNVLPRVAFTADEQEAERLGRRLALEALHAVCDGEAFPRRAVARPDGSVTPISCYRREPVDAPPPALAARRTSVRFPLLPRPSISELDELLDGFERTYDEAVASGDPGRRKVAWYSLGWARRTRGMLLDGTAPEAVDGWMHAVRIGDGVIVTAPGEAFSEIGMAVAERGPGRPTLFLGYTNGLLAYFATAAEYAYGGYEPGYSNRGVKLPSNVAPECERILVETGVRLAERLFPDRPSWPGESGWATTGALPGLEAGELRHPSMAR